MTTEVRVALIGYGLAGACFHAPTVAATPGLRLATIVTASPERRERARREHPAALVVDRVEAVFADPSGHDLVLVATPNSTHVPLALAALAAGEAVVIDKPFAPTAEEARRVVAEARRRGLFLSAYHQRRRDSDTLTLRRLIAEGALGDVLRFESRSKQNTKVNPESVRLRVAFCISSPRNQCSLGVRRGRTVAAPSLSQELPRNQHRSIRASRGQVALAPAPCS